MNEWTTVMATFRDGGREYLFKIGSSATPEADELYGYIMPDGSWRVVKIVIVHETPMLSQLGISPKVLTHRVEPI